MKKNSGFLKLFLKTFAKMFQEHPPQTSPLSKRVSLMSSSWCPFIRIYVI
jgi:hypothetical protein